VTKKGQPFEFECINSEHFWKFIFDLALQCIWIFSWSSRFFYFNSCL